MNETSERIQKLNVPEGLSLLHTLCLLLNDHLKLSKLVAQLVKKIFILNSVMETIQTNMYAPLFIYLSSHRTSGWKHIAKGWIDDYAVGTTYPGRHSN